MERSNETAYPSTFIIDQRGIVTFAKIRQEHDGRETSAEIVEPLKKTLR